MVDRSATNLVTQFSWIAEEVGYSRDKIKGYEVRLERLGRDLSEATSVFGFMSGYWTRFQIQNQGLIDMGEQGNANNALQLHAKVVAGIADKVAFVGWLEATSRNQAVESDALTKRGLELIAVCLPVIQSAFTGDMAKFNELPFVENPMGRAILSLHEIYKSQPGNFDAMRVVAAIGAAHGMLMLQSYALELRQQDYSVDLPKPGIGSGIIEVWL